MQVYESIQNVEFQGPTYLTIGNFDGVHRGHRALISQMRAAARREGAAAGLLTFHPHPASVLSPQQPIPFLTSLQERLALYRETGLDFTVVHPFTRRTAQTEAEAFMRLLHKRIGLRSLWVGPDFALGRERRGDVAFLTQLGRELGYEVVVFPEFYWEGQPVRSRKIRRLIEQGHVEWAASRLGRFYRVSGLVVQGERRGHTIGFPTANIAVAVGRVIPADGVYATWAWLGDERHPSVTNIGVRPTLNGTHRTVEAHLIDFDHDIYGQCVELELVARLREEMKFPNVQALVEQIARDRDWAAALLQKEPRIPQRERFEELPHTADWAIRVYGRDQADLYANAALAMFAMQGAFDIQGPSVRQIIEVQGLDYEDLLVNWLSELLWQSETQEALFQRFWIEQIDATSLRALVMGARNRSEMAHIKAVTYYDLSVTPPSSSDEDWVATVVFDT
ncbi:MAG: bifunctional riboflavin kinase/FAD synthetase [Chloroflexi bacterium]|nr:bifunctional riboflavin kinase/FAD synthetase [Chloroflexota bacterium]